jgi:DNA-binding MltR family transcriptional regulator
MAIIWGDTPRDRVAKAIYDVGVRNAREQIDRLSFELEEIENLVQRLRNESQTAQVLIFFSYLDDRIQALMMLQLRADQSSTEISRLFGANGPLSTFNNRVLLAFHLGWITPENRAKLDAFRKIRNEFAHRAFKVRIDDPSLAQHLAILDFNISDMMRSVGVSEPEAFSSLLCQLVMLALYTFKDMLVLPTSKAMQVGPADVAGNLDDSPALLKRVSLTLSGALLLAAGRSLAERMP